MPHLTRERWGGRPSFSTNFPIQLHLYLRSETRNPLQCPYILTGWSSSHDLALSQLISCGPSNDGRADWYRDNPSRTAGLCPSLHNLLLSCFKYSSAFFVCFPSPLFLNIQLILSCDNAIARSILLSYAAPKRDAMADCTSCDSSKVMHISVVSVFAFCALISVIFRFWARMIKSVKFQLNDYLCLGGLVRPSPQTSYPIS